MSFTAVNSSTCLVYCESDKGRGRCRIHRKTFSKLKAIVGNVARIRLNFNDGPCEVLCTLWPDRDNGGEESELCLDPSVVVSGKLPVEWSSCLAEVIQISPQKPCSSVYIYPVSIGVKELEKLNASALLGLPVSSGCTVPCTGIVSGTIGVRCCCLNGLLSLIVVLVA